MLIIKEKSFSERLKEKRKELGLTQDVFASMLDMSPRMYSYYEQGDYDNSDSIRKSKYLLKIAEIEKKEFVFGEPQTQYKKADKPENWNVIYVPIAAQAGTLAGYPDKVYEDSLQHFFVPDLPGKFWQFEVKGMSMYKEGHPLSASHKERAYCKEIHSPRDLIKGYGYMIALVEGFAYKMFDRFDDVDHSFLRRFRKFLLEEEKINPDTTFPSVWKIHRKFFNEARKSQITTNNPFENFDNPRYRDPEIIYLTEKEIEEVERVGKMPLDESMYITLNYFLLGCYSGLRYSDWARFNYDGFVSNGRLILRAKKNGEIVSMKIHKRLEAVLEKLKKLPPCFSDNESREHIQSIAKLAGIKKKIGTHTGRKTFATQCAEKGISIETTAELMGIDVRTAKVYYKVTGRKLDADIDKWDK